MTNEKAANPLKTWAAPLVAVGLIVAMASLDKLYVDPGAAAPFHLRAAAAINAVPKVAGDWHVQKEFPLDETAIKLLQVNAYLSRSYFNVRTGKSCEVLLVQCRDARAMQGHFPPVCYPSNGCKIHAIGEAQTWVVKGVAIPGMEYEVLKPDKSRFVVRDFFVLPNGKFAYDMDSVIATAKNYQQLVYGGAQVQVLFPAYYSAGERDAIFSDLMGSYSDLLEVLRSAQWKGTKPAGQAAAGGAGFPNTGRNRFD